MLKAKQVQRSGGRSQFSVSPEALGKGGRERGRRNCNVKVPCGGVGHDKGFGFFLVAVVSQRRVLSQEMPLI